MSYRKIFCIPDLHGRSDRLDAALELLNDKMDLSQDLLVILGDMVDRGKDSKGVIDTLMLLQKEHPNNVVALKGNHEDMMLDYYLKRKYDSSHIREIWYMNGGLETEQSYPTMRVSEDHIRWIGGLPYSYEAQGFFFSHAPVPREGSRDKARAGPYSVSNMTWTYYGPECDKKGALFDAHEGPLSQGGYGVDHLVGVCGHIHRGKAVDKVRVFPKYRMLDVGCGCWPIAPLAIHECVSGETWYITEPKEDNETV